MQFVEVSACDMEKGQLRCDANVSVRLKGAEKFGTKAEVKNLNSFRFLKMALDYEIARQVALIESGGRVEQETRLYDPDRGETVGMRSKEQAHDYRYFPEPDLVPLRISEEWRERVRAAMPELPAQKRARFVEQFGLREYDAQVLTAARTVSEYFEKAAAVSGDARTAANWVMGDLAAALKTSSKDISESPVTAENLGELVKLKERGDISGKQAKEIFAKMFATGDAPSAIIKREGFEQVSDQGALDDIVIGVLTSFPDQVGQYKSGKTGAVNFLVGKAMQRSKGQADPVKIKQMLEERLK
jgi:aspartyl-tRNA(Asn)/glutamyl-tRNA(Gln) amidotransferase subunit B